jgi:basic membrane protein A
MKNQTRHAKIRTVCLLALSVLLPLFLLQCLLDVLRNGSQLARAAATKVGLVAATGPLNDQGFNWGSYQGLLRAQADFGVVVSVYTTTLEANLAANLAQCVLDGNDLCITVGYSAADLTKAAALANPGLKFSILDSEYEDYSGVPNLRSTMFDASQAAYLAGVLAGSMSESHIVGAIGGMEIPAITDFTIPFQNGARCAYPGADALIVYAGDFTNPPLGGVLAQGLIASGADVIFGVAAMTGNAGVLTATQSSQWGIGVDVDQYHTLFNSGAVAGADWLLTSVQKHFDNAVYLTIADLVSGTFSSGTVVYGLSQEGVGLAPYHETDPHIPASVKARIEQLKFDIMAGRIDVHSAVCTNFMYIPIVSK